MKMIIALLALGLLGCSDDKKKAAPFTTTPVVQQKPTWTGNCDVDYITLNVKNLTELNVVIDDRGIDEPFKIKYLNELNSLPVDYLRMMGAEKVPYRMIYGGVTNFEELAFRKGEAFDDTNPDYTWDDLAGITIDDGVLLGTMPAGGNSVPIHEGGHVIDFLVGLTLKSEELKSLYSKYSDNPNPRDSRSAYRMSTIYEFFAVGFDDFYCGKKSRETLKTFYPNLWDYFEHRLINEIGLLPINKSAFKSQK